MTILLYYTLNFVSYIYSWEELLKTIKIFSYKDCIKTSSWTSEVLYIFCFVGICFYFLSFLLYSLPINVPMMTFLLRGLSERSFAAKIKQNIQIFEIFVLLYIPGVNIFEFQCVMIGTMVGIIVTLVWCYFVFSYFCLLLTLAIPISNEG